MKKNFLIRTLFIVFGFIFVFGLGIVVGAAGILVIVNIYARSNDEFRMKIIDYFDVSDIPVQFKQNTY